MHVSFHVDPAGRPPSALFEAWPTFAETAPAIADANTNVTVVQAASEDAELERAGVRYTFVRSRAPGRIRRRLGHWAAPVPARLLDAVLACDPDVLHVHSLSCPLHVSRLQQRVPAARIIVQDHADHPPPRWRRVIHRSGLAWIDAVAFTAAAQAEPFRRAGLLSPRVRVFEVAESSSTFGPGDRAAARTQTGLDGDPCLLWLAHLDANKDPLTALDALAAARRAVPDAQLWMCWGKAPLLDVVRQRIAADEWLRSRVHLLGPQPHARIETLLRAADFLVQASHSEGSGYAVIEALACGTTPVVTDIPSFRALTAGGRFAGLSAPGDAAAMARVLADWSARDRDVLRAAARAHFEAVLSFPALGRRWREIYNALLQS